MGIGLPPRLAKDPLGAATIWEIYFGICRAIRSLSASLFEEVSGTVESELAKFFDPISKSIAIVRDLGLREAFSPDDPRTASTILIPILLAILQMASNGAP